jgi:hypothetical protein
MLSKVLLDRGKYTLYCVIFLSTFVTESMMCLIMYECPLI